MAGSRVRPTLFLLIVSLSVLGCLSASSKPVQDPKPVAERPATSSPADGLPVLLNPLPDGSLDHDPSAFTQGLLFLDGKLYESTGRNGQSQLRRLDPDTGKVEHQVDADPEFFGEGLAHWDNKFYQLTWTSGVCLVYDSSMKLEKKLFYNTEGWGLTVDPERKKLVLSDGSDLLRFINPSNFVTTLKLRVSDGNKQPVDNLNELEWVQGEIWANLWTQDTIARIDPKTGKVKSWIYLQHLVQDNQTGPEDVLNGIAYDPKSDTLWLTGKLWSKIYRFDKVQEQFFSQASR